MTNQQSPLSLEQCSVYSIQGEKSIEISPAKKWTLKQRAEKIWIEDGDSFIMESGKEIIKIKYQQFQSFFIKNDNVYVAICLPIASGQTEVVEYKLQAAGVKVVEWKSASKQTQDHLRQAGGKKIAEEFPSKSSSKSTSLSYKIGGFFGALNTLVAKPAKQLNDAAGQKVEAMKEEKLSEETKSNWRRFKDKAKQLNHGMGETIRPARQKIGGITDKIGEKFDKSENSLIKGIRNFGNNLKDSLNEGYRNSMGGPVNPQLKQEHLNQQFKAPESDRNLS